MDGVINDRTINVSKSRPKPMVVPIWPRARRSLNMNEDMVNANTRPAVVTTPVPAMARMMPVLSPALRMKPPPSASFFFHTRAFFLMRCAGWCTCDVWSRWPRGRSPKGLPTLTSLSSRTSLSSLTSLASTLGAGVWDVGGVPVPPGLHVPVLGGQVEKNFSPPDRCRWPCLSSGRCQSEWQSVRLQLRVVLVTGLVAEANLDALSLMSVVWDSQ